jgi:23S rRNA (adenine2503-C2)-methyltransferase
MALLGGKSFDQMTLDKKDIKNLTLEELREELAAFGERPYRARQIFAWVYQKGAQDFASLTDLPQKLRENLDRHYFLSALELFGHFKSKDKTEKFLFRLRDGNFIETVLIPTIHRETVCISTQVGCKFACAFCASGLPGFTRNLTSSEIINQVLYLRDMVHAHITNLVFMGMGEPFDNCQNVIKAIEIMNSTQGLGIAARRMTVSTCGLIPGVRRFKTLGFQVNLSLSLHATNDALRNKLMPVNRKYPLEELMRACEDYIQSGGRKMTLEYVLIQDVNDSAQDAAGLAGVAKRLKAKVNLIPYSPIAGLNFKPPDDQTIEFFMRSLERKKVGVTLRGSKGADILAACGQLAGRART